MTDSVLPRSVTTPVTPAIAAVCPYLMASDGRWRASTPSREHRCTVVTPPAILAAEKQRRLCLSVEHVGCSTYLAATNPTDADEPVGAPAGRPTRPVTRTAPLVLDHGRLAIGIPTFRGERGAGQQGGLVALMAVAFAAIVVARLSTGGPGLTPVQAVGGAASPSAGASPAPTVRSAATDAPTRTLVPTEVEPTPAPVEASDVPSDAPSEAPRAAPRTYTVRSGDTLMGIAGEFGTTVKDLMELNGIENARLLRVGQVLDLP